MVRGLPHVDHVEQLYDTCVVTKQRHCPFPHQANYRATERLELMHEDLCGLVTPVMPGGRCYFLLLINYASHYMWAMLLDTKAVVADTIVDDR
jgi:hypothetical protein